jgi:hypothetical protein
MSTGFNSDPLVDIPEHSDQTLGFTKANVRGTTNFPIYDRAS